MVAEINKAGHVQLKGTGARKCFCLHVSPCSACSESRLLANKCSIVVFWSGKTGSGVQTKFRAKAKKVEIFSVPNGRPRARPGADSWCRWAPNGHIRAAKGVPSLVHTPVTTVDALQRSEGPSCVHSGKLYGPPSKLPIISTLLGKLLPL